MSSTVIILLMCLNTHCVRDTIPFDGTVKECVIQWQLPAIQYMQIYRAGYVLKRASCTPDGIEL
jgi:hypothetical protein